MYKDRLKLCVQLSVDHRAQYLWTACLGPFLIQERQIGQKTRFDFSQLVFLMGHIGAYLRLRPIEFRPSSAHRAYAGPT